jgi:hypothetical protein
MFTAFTMAELEDIQFQQHLLSAAVLSLIVGNMLLSGSFLAQRDVLF